MEKQAYFREISCNVRLKYTDVIVLLDFSPVIISLLTKHKQNNTSSLSIYLCVSIITQKHSFPYTKHSFIPPDYNTKPTSHSLTTHQTHITFNTPLTTSFISHTIKSPSHGIFFIFPKPTNFLDRSAIYKWQTSAETQPKEVTTTAQSVPKTVAYYLKTPLFPYLDPPPTTTNL